jgi:hypothetical protein
MALGGIAGAAVIQSHHHQKRKSQAEKDDPEGVEWICDLVWDLLDDWEPPACEREDDYTDDLVQFLRDRLSDERSDDGRRIGVIKRTKTFRGIPDILIDDRLVLELKVDPREAKRIGLWASAANILRRGSHGPSLLTCQMSESMNLWNFYMTRASIISR